MTVLAKDWKFRMLIILLVLAVTSLLSTLLTFTTWAEEVRMASTVLVEQGSQQEEVQTIPKLLMFIVPFIKEAILIGVPLFLALLAGKLYARGKSKT